MKTKSLYIHIPFCKEICPYCDFFKVKNHPKLIKQIIDRYKQDIHSIEGEITTLYIGGGTPSGLEIDQIKPLLETLKRFSPSEFTIECNPESLTKEKIKYYVSMGINRVSMGVQSSQTKFLKILGRNHHFEIVQEKIKWLKELGITNISIDLMYGLPTQSLEDLYSDLKAFLTLDIPHISIYTLTIEPNTLFYRNKVKSVESELETKMYELILSFLEKNGYHHYEIASFAKKGYESQHNLGYWTYQDFIGIGPGASGKENHSRYTNIMNINDYLTNENTKQEFIELSIKDEMFETMMMGLRLKQGVSKVDFQMRYKQSIQNVFKQSIQKHSTYFIEDKQYIKLTEEGRLMLHDILVDFLEEVEA